MCYKIKYNVYIVCDRDKQSAQKKLHTDSDTCY